MKTQGDAPFGQGHRFVQFPRRGARETVGRFAFAWAEPGKDHGHTTANRLIGSEAAELTGKEQRGLAFFLKVRDMRAMEIDFGGAAVGTDFDLGQTSIAFHEGNAAGDFQPT